MEVRTTFGSTGSLTQQVREGAPVDLLLAADAESVETLESAGYLVPETSTVYARGTLSIWSDSADLKVLTSLKDVTRPQVRHISVADPRLAPYGRAACAALRKAGYWEIVEKRLVYARDALRALEYARTGNAEVALIPVGLASRAGGSWVPIPSDLHDPLDHVGAVIRGSLHEKEARAFLLWLKETEAREILKEFGYLVPAQLP